MSFAAFSKARIRQNSVSDADLTGVFVDKRGPANDEPGDENSMACAPAEVLSDAAAGRRRELDTSQSSRRAYVHFSLQ